jgi:hypothetical protein
MVNSSLASGDEKPNKISANEIVIERAWEPILDLKRVIFFLCGLGANINIMLFKIGA